MVDLKQLRSLNDLFTNVISQIFLTPANTTGSGHNELSWTQRKILMTIHANGPQKMSAVAKQIGVTMSGATAVIDKLVQAGLVSRELSPADRRVVLVELTEKGRQLLSESMQAQERHFEAVLDRLSPDKQVELLESFKRIHTLLLELQDAPDAGDRQGEPAKGTLKTAVAAERSR